ncbi:3-dehydroquinate synthase [Pontibacter flavimaris]|uniref:3-dehydroquinate synthase n=1 Tax=Pontibacter flavimaris TaxID=1797110 RepID=A0A1Q5PDC9_9BACT|nr:3-dehydroquinate synthase [Pontibacter flavimaris]OKL40245.1 3-dehydroquinate synthase [Pontibacter flavimaris]
MKSIIQEFQVPFTYGIYFTEGLFSKGNPMLTDILKQKSDGTGPRKVLFVVDEGVAKAHPNLLSDLATYTAYHSNTLTAVADAVLIPGGEEAKNDPALLDRVLEAIHKYGVCRHSYLIAIGGGAVLDMAGFAAATAHRGIRHIRIPTTVLSQNDSGVGVKNSFNAFGKKNFLGTFAPPFAVINDSKFLPTLEDRDWRGGIAEAIKVALIKDSAFYTQIKQNAAALVAREMKPMQELIFRCAQMHVEHIGSGDPFEFGSSRPLDFGHWAAHKLEQVTNYTLCHGEAVAIGIALDVTYSKLAGMLSEAEWENILSLLYGLGFALYIPELSHGLETPAKELLIWQGLQEFREHLGGQLTIMLLEKIGVGVEVHHLDAALVSEAVSQLQQWQPKGLLTVTA